MGRRALARGVWSDGVDCRRPRRPVDLANDRAAPRGGDGCGSPSGPDRRGLGIPDQPQGVRDPTRRALVGLPRTEAKQRRTRSASRGTHPGTHRGKREPRRREREASSSGRDAVPGAEDGSHRQPDWRRGARFQQFAAGYRGQSATACARARGKRPRSRSHRKSHGGRRAGCSPCHATAGFRPSPAAGAESRQRREADPRHGRSTPANDRRGGRYRDSCCRRPVEHDGRSHQS